MEMGAGSNQGIGHEFQDVTRELDWSFGSQEWTIPISQEWRLNPFEFVLVVGVALYLYILQQQHMMVQSGMV